VPKFVDFVDGVTHERTQTSSADAEMGDRRQLGHYRHAPKSGGLLCPFPWGSWVPI